MGYILEMQEAGAEEWTKAHEKTLRNTEHVVTGLTAGKKYCFRVAGININGTGDFSEPCAETEPVERIGESLLKEEMFWFLPQILKTLSIILL